MFQGTIPTISKEAQQLVQRALSRRITDWATTAFTDNPNSSKYGRGVPGCRLTKRTSPATDKVHKFQLQYGGPIGQMDLAESLAYWKKKHAGDLR